MKPKTVKFIAIILVVALLSMVAASFLIYL